MSDYDPKAVLLELFIRLRRNGFELGIDELLAAYKAVDGGWGTDSPDALRELVQLLWCNAPQELLEFDQLYDELLATGLPLAKPAAQSEMPSQLPPPPAGSTPGKPPSAPVQPAPEQQAPQLAVLPVRTPTRPLSDEPKLELRAYWPVSRRDMIYTWRYLRRPLPDGPRDQLNVDATVEQAARQGYFLQPVYDRRERNHAHLVLLIDQGGSMTPFHRFSRDLIETACDESSIERVDVVYFHNVPPESIYQDPHLMQPQPLTKLLAECNPDSSLLFVSDAGAARGHRRLARIRATAECLARLKRVSSFIAWLNPMPAPRWDGTSAQFIAGLVPMFQMDPDGFSNAVDCLRGQLAQR